MTIVDNDTNLIMEAGAFLTSESGPVNMAVDPGETVTVQLGLKNAGNVPTSNLVATLQANANLTPRAPVSRTYGALQPNGFPAFQPFTFTANGPIGFRLVAALVLTDGSQSLGTANFFFTIGGAATNRLVSTNAIVINDEAAATPYPSLIGVSGISGNIASAKVTLNGFTHDYPDDVDILLEGPGGQTVMLMSDSGGSHRVSNATLTFDDAASGSLPDEDQIVSGTYKPSNFAGPGSGDSFPPPAPQPVSGGISPYTNTSLSIFRGTDPNGIWKLYVVDAVELGAGRISNGWSLTFITADLVAISADVASFGQGAPTDVSPGADVTYTLGITNFGPAGATSLLFSNILSPNAIYVSSSRPSLIPSGQLLSDNLGNLSLGQGLSFTITVRPTGLGTITNIAAVLASEVDPNPANNRVVITTTVSPPPLAIVRNVNNVTLSWPASASGYTLQETSELSPATWRDVSATPTVIGGRKVVVMPVASAASKCYRLRRP
jgi:uncharacterized repeat protein (TIGR01451 family)